MLKNILYDNDYDENDDDDDEDNSHSSSLMLLMMIIVAVLIKWNANLEVDLMKFSFYVFESLWQMREEEKKHKYIFQNSWGFSSSWFISWLVEGTDNNNINNKMNLLIAC